MCMVLPSHVASKSKDMRLSTLRRESQSRQPRSSVSDTFKIDRSQRLSILRMPQLSHATSVRGPSPMSTGSFSYVLCGWFLHCKNFFEAWRLGQEQSCVRPVGAGQRPLALMGSADRVPLCLTDKECPGHNSDFLDPRSDPDCHHFASSSQTVSVFGPGLV